MAGRGLLLGVAAAAIVLAQSSTRVADLASGKLLVASRSLQDPNFVGTVILLIQYDSEGTVGLVINRRTKVPLSRALEELKGSQSLSEPVFAGGPVQRTAVMALLRSRAKIEEGKEVVAGVYVVSTRAVLEKSLASGSASDTVRVFLGYSGWGPGQLERELKLGAWHILRGSAGLVFDPDPEGLWGRLIGQTELQIAKRAGSQAAPLRFPDAGMLLAFRHHGQRAACDYHVALVGNVEDSTGKSSKVQR
ncbi:MAG: YqgE/AlgH family protein [Bryobacteraceae bacterium]